MTDVRISALLNRNGMPGTPAYACTSRVLLPRIRPVRRGWGSTSLKIPLPPLMAALRWLLREPGVIMTDAEREEYSRDMGLAGGEAPEVDRLESLEMLADVLQDRLVNQGGEPIVFADDLQQYPAGCHCCLQRDAVELRVKFVHPSSPTCFAEGAANAEFDPGGRCLNVRLDDVGWNSPDDPDDTAHIQLDFKFNACAPYGAERDGQLHQFANGFNAQLHLFEDAMQALQAAQLQT